VEESRSRIVPDRHQIIGDPERGSKRGLILKVEGDRMLVQYYDGTTAWESTPHELRDRESSVSSGLKSSRVRFDHRSEQQFARLLDFYEIEWEYEPRTFELFPEHEGAPDRFTPDFYLPAFDLYIEISTLNEKLVTKKNRKIRRLLERYPSVRCKLLYQRDYLNLLTKYGLEDVVHASPPAQEQDRRSETVEASRADFKALISAA